MNKREVKGLLSKYILITRRIHWTTRNFDPLATWFQTCVSIVMNDLKKTVLLIYLSKYRAMFNSEWTTCVWSLYVCSVYIGVTHLVGPSQFLAWHLSGVVSEHGQFDKINDNRLAIDRDTCGVRQTLDRPGAQPPGTSQQSVTHRRANVPTNGGRIDQQLQPAGWVTR